MAAMTLETSPSLTPGLAALLPQGREHRWPLVSQAPRRSLSPCRGPLGYWTLHWPLKGHRCSQPPDLGNLVEGWP